MDKNKDILAKCAEFTQARELMATGLYPYFRPIEATCGRSVNTDGKRRVMIGSNNYLGLTHHPKVIAGAVEAVKKFGTGCTGSRFLNGNLSLHEQLEEELADYLGKESCIVFSTGFFTNQGALSCLVGRHDVIYCDRENHASIIEGTRLATGKTLKFKHNDMEDLERVLKTTRDRFEGALIVADGIFSMSGDILKLVEIYELAQKYDCRVLVDDAHALGVVGPKGEGTAHHFGRPEMAEVLTGTFSKSFASVGGFVAGDKTTMHFVKHRARPFMFSAAMPPASVGAVLACLDLVRNEPEHLEALRRNAKKMSVEIRKLGYNTLGSQTPIIPLLVGDYFLAFEFTQALYEEGVFATPVVEPAVPNGCALIRTSYMATHTEDDLNYVLEVLDKLGRRFGIVGNTERQSELAELARTHFGKDESEISVHHHAMSGAAPLSEARL